jgi:very-short-patch-repair endonuclease
MKMEEEPFTNYGTKEFPLYLGAELYHKNLIPRTTVRDCCNKLPKEYVFKKSKIKLMTTNRKHPTTIYATLVSLNGLKHILCATRRPIPKEILDYYNIEEYNRFQCEEAKWLNNIIKAFPGETIKIQYAVGPYRLDAYFPIHNIVLEIDEGDHKYYSPAEELGRAAYLNEALVDPHFIRFDPFVSDIFDVIGRVYREINRA